MDKEGVKSLEPFIKKIKKKFKPKLILLFGSRARGDYLKESDYDLIVVSEKFRGVHFLKRMEMIYELLDDVPYHVDVLCYTPDEFEKMKKGLNIVRKAVEEGVEV